MRHIPGVSNSSSLRHGLAVGSYLETSERLAHLRGLRVLVGNTPLLAIELELDGHPATVYCKAEQFNFTGSIKDRMALHVLRRGYETGALSPHGVIAEATSGNTGISFAALGRALGHRVVIFMPDWMSDERKALIRSFGAEVRLVSSAEGGFRGSIRFAEEMARNDPEVFLPRQFENEENIAAHESSTGPESWMQLGWHVLTPDAFGAGVGTGGTIMGVGRYLRRQREEVRLHPVEPASSPTLSTGHKVGTHRIQGVSDEFIPPIVDLSKLDRIVAVDDGDAILMAQKLGTELGLGVGISSGANFLAAVRVQRELGPSSVVATVFADSNKKYLTTDLLRDEPAKPDFMAPRVRLLGLRALNRVCEFCADPSDAASNPVGVAR